jgi:serine/threonine-protein kinase RsbW
MAVGQNKLTEISLPSSAEYLPHLRKIISCFAASVGMGSQEIQDAKLAFNEACSNAIRHGSPMGEENSINIRLLTNSQYIVTEVTDEGTGFDPLSLPPKDVSTPGGLGIPLMKALSDNVEFEKNGHGMTVRMVKKAKMRLRRRRI